jgi:16S rRNA (uracil1498-N3)-methyltransferase
LPELVGPVTLAAALAREATGALKLCLDPSADANFGAALARRGTLSLVLLVGPEGGFSEPELAAATQAGFARVKLGSLVLRTELAGIAALGAVVALA